MGETFDKELVKKQYPYPIAIYYAQMQKEEMLISKKKSLYQKLFKKMSLGDWLSIFRDGSRYFVKEENLFFPELNSYAIKKVRESLKMRRL